MDHSDAAAELAAEYNSVLIGNHFSNVASGTLSHPAGENPDSLMLFGGVNTWQWSSSTGISSLSAKRTVLHDRCGIDDSADDFADEASPLNPSADDVDGKPYIRRAAKGEFALGQLGDMHNLSTNQHRLFSYGFYVQWRWARLLYFDRTGALISEPFD
ncbi:hypothetical protein LXA43DRAFT_1143462 [Ganoderma leucocontextum]|nr:hypothetical protein LXA43DRAFT_1143462 [Ganoderma leucocontextum]